MKTKTTNIYALVEAAVLVALATALSYVRLFEAPQGGSITAFCMLPIILVGIRRGPVWGFCAGLVFGALQALQGGAFVALQPFALFMDYLLPFGALGLSGFFRKYKWGFPISIAVCSFARFMFHFLSGIIIWGSYAPEDVPVVLYSLGYNGGFMGIEFVLTFIVGLILFRTVPKKVLLNLQD